MGLVTLNVILISGESRKVRTKSAPFVTARFQLVEVANSAENRTARNQTGSDSRQPVFLQTKTIIYWRT